MSSNGDALIGRTLDGRYRVLRRLADGGMATVYLALDERLGPLLPALEKLLAQQGQSVDDLGAALQLPR